MPSILLSLRSLSLPPGDESNQRLPAGEREREGERMRGVGWVVLEAWSDEMVEGMAMDLVSRYISLFNRKHEKNSF